MSDRICTNCGGGTAIGCFLCNPEAYPRDSSFDLQVRIDQRRETIGRLIDQADGYRDRIAALEAEVARLDRYLNEGYDRIRELEADWLNIKRCMAIDADELEALLKEGTL